jgi:uncharacterized protein (TIGR03067 family)
LKLDAAKKPAQFDMFAKAGDATPYGTGIVKREGNRIRLVYDWTNNRPTSFDNPPKEVWELVLERE